MLIDTPRVRDTGIGARQQHEKGSNSSLKPLRNHPAGGIEAGFNLRPEHASSRGNTMRGRECARLHRAFPTAPRMPRKVLKMHLGHEYTYDSSASHAGGAERP